ncbi:MAG: polyphosphate kinase 1 [Halofilum sp. (in: g-proteobacteria)]|nr:polyphosphate kinase 1 [Halofilum sp. (in: g-proteobacteria)]
MGEAPARIEQQPVADRDPQDPALYINRELSLLEFNHRVLEQAKDTTNPLLERLRFLCISSTNLDEFFEIRVAGLMQKAEVGAIQVGSDQMQPTEVLEAIGERAHELVDEQYRVLNDILIPQLAEEGIRFVRRSEWTDDQERWLRNYFENELLPVISPMGLDPAHPFPRILNKSLNFIVSLRGKDAFGRSGGTAIVQAPRALPRVIQLPPGEEGNGCHDFVFLTSVIHTFVEQLFPGMRVRGCYQFRVTRNSDLFVDEEEVDDLLLALEGELASRRYGDGVRLEIADNCPDDMADFLLRKFELGRESLYQVNGPVNLNRLLAVYDLVDRSDLKYPPFQQAVPTAMHPNASIFDTIARRDVLLHHPFDSFTPVIDFLRQAAADPKVLAVKQTLYRTGPDSPVVDQLVAAAKAGKEVTVVVELRARFDEQENITLANRLQEAGAHVVYGIVGYKTHAKMILIVRREKRGLRNYIHLGTGNYHTKTARAYTDYGLLSASRALGQDVHNMFLQLTSLGRVPEMNRLLHAPFTLHSGLLERIAAERDRARAGEPARIIAKLNSLVEPKIIAALYEAAAAGVSIDLIVRGMCCLRPGVEGISENIRVRSIVGRFLEHTRVYYFENGGQPQVWLASADWMERNFFRRVETCFPIENRRIRERLVRELESYLADNTQAWLLGPDGRYERAVPSDNEEPYSVQQALLAEAAESLQTP